jgi:hypothetical protein
VEIEFCQREIDSKEAGGFAVHLFCGRSPSFVGILASSGLVLSRPNCDFLFPHWFRFASFLLFVLLLCAAELSSFVHRMRRLCTRFLYCINLLLQFSF